MPVTIDARGLSCPQPVLMTLSKIKEIKTGEIEVLVDNEVSRENVARSARNQKWEVTEAREESGDYRLKLKSQ